MWINVRASTWSKKKKKKKLKKVQWLQFLVYLMIIKKDLQFPAKTIQIYIYIYIYDNIVLFNFLGYFFKPKIN